MKIYVSLNYSFTEYFHVVLARLVPWRPRGGPTDSGRSLAVVLRQPLDNPPTGSSQERGKTIEKTFLQQFRNIFWNNFHWPWGGHRNLFSIICWTSRADFWAFSGVRARELGGTQAGLDPARPSVYVACLRKDCFLYLSICWSTYFYPCMQCHVMHCNVISCTVMSCEVM